MSHTSQIFHTQTQKRWTRVKWTSRIIGIVIAFFLFVTILPVINATNPSLPEINDRAKVYRAILNPNCANLMGRTRGDLMPPVKQDWKKKLNLFFAEVTYYLIFTLVDIAGAALAFAFEKEDYKKLLWMIPQRLIYRQLMY